MAEKKNLDYSASAVNLVNPPSVGALLRQLQSQQDNLAILRQQAESYIPPQIKASIAAVELDVDLCRTSIQTAVEEHGSFQDLEAGLYGIKQRRVTVSYDPAEFKRRYPQFGPAVIIEAVDDGKLKGLIKGGLLDMKVLLTTKVAQEKESFRFIIEAKPQSKGEGK